MHYVVTLAEKDYLIGAVALFNSLVRNGFEGIFVIGYRDLDKLPKLTLESINNHNSDAIRLFELNTPIHFTNFKPQFMKLIASSHSDLTVITYLDPDIILTSPFSWIKDWSSYGPLVCADVNYWFPSHHPLRRIWLNRLDLVSSRNLDYYVNGGFLSIRRVDLGFLDLWQSIINSSVASTRNNKLYAQGEIENTRGSGRWDPFLALDQDALNIALMCFDSPVSILGPDIMGFTALGYIPHAIGSCKPWERFYFLYALKKGVKPRAVDKAFWSYVNYPLMNYKKYYLLLRKLDLFFALLLSRFA